MKTKLTSILSGVLLTFAMLGPSLPAAHGQGTAFTYQGRLASSGNPVTGSFDLAFTLFNTSTGGTSAATPVTNFATAVSNGVFTTTIDFGTGVFTGGTNWLEIAVQTNGGSGFITLAPRQQLTPVPYAITAANFSGVLPVATLPGFQSPAYSTVGGGATNVAADTYSTVAGGTKNIVQTLGTGSAIGGGTGNTVTNATFITSFGGSDSTIGGGLDNQVFGDFGTIGGGVSNTVKNFGTGNAPTIAGGWGNMALSLGAVGGGYANNANDGGMVPGGIQNNAGGICSFAAGQNASATHDGSFVWADGSTAGSFSDVTSSQFLIRAAGGVGINTSQTPPNGLRVNGGGLAVTGASSPNYGTAQGVFIEKTSTAGAVYAYNYGTSAPTSLLLNSPGGNVGIGTTLPGALLQVGSATCNGSMWLNTSDRNVKEGFAAINPREVLEKVSALPITEWKYKAEATGTEHLGPMAQDFHAAFGLNGTDDKQISTVDEGGVALAAIQGLNQKLQEELGRQSTENAKLKEQNDRLAERLNELEAKVKQLAAGK